MGPELVLLSRVAFRGREITAPRLRDLLALLAADPGGCGAGRLVDGLWPDEQPENPPKALQILVSRARRHLGSEIIARTPTGYRLTLDEDRVDSSAILVLAAAAARCVRGGDHLAALEHANAGLALWDGAAGEADGAVGALRAERQVAHRALGRTRALALARLGRDGEALDLLAELAVEGPRDEEVLVELLRCEAATRGPAMALARYEAYRRGLRDELGVDPGVAVQREYRRLLRAGKAPVRIGVVHEPNWLVGRDDDVAAVEGLVRVSRVTSIVGAGGLGKTRLAQVVAGRAQVGTVVVVPLAGLGSADEVAPEVAGALGVEGDLLEDGPILLVLDNCEHVVGGVAEYVRELVAVNGDVRVLTTSRAPLGLSSESVYLLPELGFAASIELFRQRARAARSGVELPEAAVAEVCRRLDGLPLAIELAAARVRVMSVAEIGRRLDDRLGLLRGGARDSPERHRTLAAVVEWSWNLLDDGGRAAMRTLSVFPDGFTGAAAAVVLGPHSAEVLEQLVGHSLVKVADTACGVRFRMLETVREFSRASGAGDSATEAFLAWARQFGVAHHADLLGPEPYDAAGIVAAEQENLWHATRLALERDDRDTVAAVAAVLGGLWVLQSSSSRMAVLVRQTAWPLSHYRPAPELVEVTRTALTMAVIFAFGAEGARPGRAVAALRRLGVAPPGTVVRAVGWLVGAAGDPAELERLCDSTEPLLTAAASMLAGYRLESAGNVDAAVKGARRALEVVTERDLPWPRALAHCRIAELCLHLEQGAEARAHLLAALPVLQRLGARADAAGAQSWLVLANLQAGDTAEAERWMAGLRHVTLDEEEITAAGYGLGIWAEMLFARGEVAAGLRMWRRVADEVGGTAGEVDPWVVEARCVAVVAHARHDRSELVADLAGELPARLAHLLAHPLAHPPPYLVEQTLCGTLLLAVAMVDLARARRTGDPARARSAARMVALAERFGFRRTFQPTMSAAAARADAQRADLTAYEQGVVSFSDLDGAALRAEAMKAVQRMRSRL